MSAGHRHTPPNHHVVEVDEDYRISRLDRTVVVTDVDVCVELPSDEVLVGHTIRIVAGAGDVIVCTCSAAIEGADEDGQLVIPRGTAVELTLSDDKCNCSKVWVPDCCPEGPGCFTDAQIAEFLRTQSIPGDAAAFAAFFTPSGCIEFNLEADFRICTPAEIQALFGDVLPTILERLEFQLLSIDRLKRPDGTATLLLHVNVTETDLEGTVRRIHEHWALHLDAECKVTLFQVFQLLESSTPPPSEAEVSFITTGGGRRSNRFRRAVERR